LITIFDEIFSIDAYVFGDNTVSSLIVIHDSFGGAMASSVPAT